MSRIIFSEQALEEYTELSQDKKTWKNHHDT